MNRQPLDSEVEELLRFYADRRAHSGVGVSAVYRDNGRMARLFLGECENERCKGIGGWADNNARHGWQRCPDCRGSGVKGQGNLVGSKSR